MRVALWFGIPVVVAVLLALLSKCMGVAWGVGITGAAVVLLGTFVLSGDQWEWFRRKFNWMSPRFGAIESGLSKLRGDPSKPRYLRKGQSGFQEILEVIAERMRIEPSGISAIRCGSVGAEDSVVREHVGLCEGTSSLPRPDTITTKGTFEQWIRDARVRSLSCLGFGIVAFGVSLGLVSLVMQAIGSRS